MIKNRRVGTLSAGVSMVVFGILFLLRLFVPAVTLRLIVSLWPLVLVFLGIETLLAYAMNREEKMRYDAGSVVLIVALAFFTVCMAAAQIAAEHSGFLNFP
ncbi:hypothetical protein EQM14_12480 [Caproiciproducens sp. NJN-50]|uniref:LiaF transmembrane domain-containing protein n=1 Tax=Acutalibacteraceae TaxID=3082771 RepID=UPI000FFE1AC7|nr:MULTISPECIES: hypothetical protein [Acutalibacteraceae]QAT50513.1 hypothetical protein EQM14_12480 [Caproiciproducens sp. NJN-50]